MTFNICSYGVTEDMAFHQTVGLECLPVMPLTACGSLCVVSLLKAVDNIVYLLESFIIRDHVCNVS